MELFTIGFTKKRAEDFFSLLAKNKVKLIIDTRVNNVSQLSGFAKNQDLKFFLKKIADIDYIHVLDFAPTKNLLSAYRKKEITWETYEIEFKKLIQKRQIEQSPIVNSLDQACLLCSEAKPHNCHRRLVAEYFQYTLKQRINIKHL